MDAAATARLEADGVALDAADVALLRAIAATGSVSAAAGELERSRARALARLDELEGAFGPLVERTRGGADGGGSRLTDDARELMARFERLRAALSGTAGAAEWVVAGEVVAVEGELVTVATPVGRIRAVAVDPDDREPEASKSADSTAVADTAPDFDIDATLGVGDPVQVAVRADAVTLQDADESPAPDATSARNRLVGRVATVDRGEAVATVTVAVDDADIAPLPAVLTLDSVGRLGLEPGREVVATFKATATRGIEAVADG